MKSNPHEGVSQAHRGGSPAVKAHQGQSPTMKSNLHDGWNSHEKIAFLIACAKANLWHRRLSHPSNIIFHQMLSLLTGHNLSTSDATKAIDYNACIQEKKIKCPFIGERA